MIHDHDKQEGGEALLQLRSLSKTFPGTRALIDVDFDIAKGEVHALVGQNGSGKSTLIKVLAGYHGADPGSQATFEGEQIDLSTGSGSRHDGLRFVHQDLGLILEMSAMDNMALRGGFVRRFGRRIDWRAQETLARELLARFDATLDVTAPLSEATPIQRTIVAIAIGLAGWSGGEGLLVLDEPTAVLPHAEVDRLLQVVQEVKAAGTSVLYVSHRLDEVLGIADRVTVLRDGQRIATRPAAGLTAQSLAELLVGSKVDAHFRATQPVKRDERVAFRAEHVSGRYLRDTSIQVRVGEVLGIAGYPGSGAEELPLIVAGAHLHHVEGNVQFPQKSAVAYPASGTSRPTTPIVPADRGRDGVIVQMSVQENLSLSALDGLTTRAALSTAKESELVETWFSTVAVKTSSPHAPIGSLSGGNQQKVMLARCMAVEPDVLVLMEPTAGVDVGTRQAIYELIAARAKSGLSVVVTSTDLGDLIALCHRVLVMQKGSLVSELSGEAITEHALLKEM